MCGSPLHLLGVRASPLSQVLVELFQSDIKLWQAYVRALRVSEHLLLGHCVTVSLYVCVTQWYSDTVQGVTNSTH